MNDYVARAREASRRWRLSQGLPPREDDLFALPALASQGKRLKARETLAHEVNAIEETKETKEKKVNESLGSRSLFPETDLRQKFAESLPAALRQVFRAQFLLAVRAVDGTLPDPGAIRGLRQDVARLTDEAGPLWADALFADELRRFRWETGRCGLCGGLAHSLKGS